MIGLGVKAINGLTTKAGKTTNGTKYVKTYLTKNDGTLQLIEKAVTKKNGRTYFSKFTYNEQGEKTQTNISFWNKKNLSLIDKIKFFIKKVVPANHHINIEKTPLPNCEQQKTFKMFDGMKKSIFRSETTVFDKNGKIKESEYSNRHIKLNSKYTHLENNEVQQVTDLLDSQGNLQANRIDLFDGQKIKQSKYKDSQEEIVSNWIYLKNGESQSNKEVFNLNGEKKYEVITLFDKYKTPKESKLIYPNGEEHILSNYQNIKDAPAFLTKKIILSNEDQKILDMKSILIDRSPKTRGFTLMELENADGSRNIKTYDEMTGERINEIKTKSGEIKNI